MLRHSSTRAQNIDSLPLRSQVHEITGESSKELTPKQRSHKIRVAAHAAIELMKVSQKGLGRYGESTTPLLIAEVHDLAANDSRWRTRRLAGHILKRLQTESATSRLPYLQATLVSGANQHDIWRASIKTALESKLPPHIDTPSPKSFYELSPEYTAKIYRPIAPIKVRPDVSNRPESITAA